MKGLDSIISKGLCAVSISGNSFLAFARNVWCFINPQKIRPAYWSFCWWLTHVVFWFQCCLLRTNCREIYGLVWKYGLITVSCPVGVACILEEGAIGPREPWEHRCNGERKPQAVEGWVLSLTLQNRDTNLEAMVYILVYFWLWANHAHLWDCFFLIIIIIIIIKYIIQKKV